MTIEAFVIWQPQILSQFGRIDSKIWHSSWPWRGSLPARRRPSSDGSVKTASPSVLSTSYSPESKQICSKSKNPDRCPLPTSLHTTPSSSPVRSGTAGRRRRSKVSSGRATSVAGPSSHCRRMAAPWDGILTDFTSDVTTGNFVATTGFSRVGGKSDDILNAKVTEWLKNL